VYPVGFPAVGAVAATDAIASPAIDPSTAVASAAGVGLSTDASSGAGVLALAELLHGQRARTNYLLTQFGVLLAGPWSEVSGGQGGTLSARGSGRGSAVLPIALTSCALAARIADASAALATSFDQPIKGWWIHGEAPNWGKGPYRVAAEIEKVAAHRHELGTSTLRGTARPLLALRWSADDQRNEWLFMRRSASGIPAFGRNEMVSASRFQVRAPYALDIDHARVLIVGCGSLGWPVAIGLARAGVRRFTLIDADRLHPGNLARLGAQLAQVGEQKVMALRDALLQVASGIDVEVHPLYVGETADAHALAEARPDLIIDTAADDLTPNQINAAALALGVPAIYAWMTRGVRSARIFRSVPGRTPCYACVANARPRSLVEERRSAANEFTWIGANFNIEPVAAAVVRTAVLTLAWETVDASNPDHYVLRLGGVVPRAQILGFVRDPSCAWCA
jgi:molybdopterin/thiamine biosynthesis adenylyltransferase